MVCNSIADDVNESSTVEPPPKRKKAGSYSRISLTDPIQDGKVFNQGYKWHAINPDLEHFVFDSEPPASGIKGYCCQSSSHEFNRRDWFIAHDAVCKDSIPWPLTFCLQEELQSALTLQLALEQPNNHEYIRNVSYGALVPGIHPASTSQACAHSENENPDFELSDDATDSTKSHRRAIQEENIWLLRVLFRLQIDAYYKDCQTPSP